MGTDIKIQRWSDRQQGPLEISLDEWSEAVAGAKHARLAQTDSDKHSSDNPCPVRKGDVEIKEDGGWRRAIYWMDRGRNKGSAFFQVDSVKKWSLSSDFLGAVVDICRRLNASLVTDDLQVIDPETLAYRGYVEYSSPVIKNSLVRTVYQLIQSLTVEGFDHEAEKIRNAVVPLATEDEIAETIRPILYDMYELPISDETRQCFSNIFRELNGEGRFAE